MELDYAELFGVSEDDEDEGEEVQETAEPAEENDLDEGEEAQEIAEPASEEEDETTDPVGQTGKPGRTERDAGFAAARRRAEAERDAAIERVRQEERTRANELIRRMGIRNPAKPGTNIESLEDLEQYEATMNQRQFQQKLRRGELTAEDIARSVLESQTMQPVREIRQRLEQERQAEQETQIRERIEADVKTISAMDPEVTSLQDIMEQAEYPGILDHVKQGMSLADAYKLVHFDRLTGRQADRASRAARNSAAGKSHLRATGSRGGGGTEVSREELAEFRKFMPDATVEEIRAFKARQKQ